jgi:hypothetical protein
MICWRTCFWRTTACYGNLALLNSSRMKYNTNTRADPARKASASHVLCLMVKGDTSTSLMQTAISTDTPKGLPLDSLSQLDQVTRTWILPTATPSTPLPCPIVVHTTSETG